MSNMKAVDYSISEIVWKVGAIKSING